MGLFSSRDNPDFEITDFSLEKHDEYYQKGFNCIDPYVRLGSRPSRRPNADKIRKGIKYLDAATKINSENWAAFWLKGKAYQALGDSAFAYKEFKKAFDIEKENADVARELMIESLNLGKGEEGVEIGKHALSLEPNNPGLMGNLGLAYLIKGEINNAEDITRKAISLNPQDGINKQILNIINEVKSGKRAQPRKYSDLMN
jgi:tetratricopeptide (TPR) repeat protein